MRKEIFPFSIMLILIALDRWSKAWMLAHIASGPGISVCPFLSFTYVENKGIAFGTFGMLRNGNALLLCLTIIILALLIIFRRQFCSSHKASKWGFWLVCAGGIGNICDRIIYGFVVDFINLSFFPAIFNVADSAITIGAILMGWGILMDPEAKKKEKSAEGKEVRKTGSKEEKNNISCQNLKDISKSGETK